MIKKPFFNIFKGAFAIICLLTVFTSQQSLSQQNRPQQSESIPPGGEGPYKIDICAFVMDGVQHFGVICFTPDLSGPCNKIDGICYPPRE